MKLVLDNGIYQTINKEKERKVKSEVLDMVGKVFKKAEDTNDEEYLIMMLAELKSFAELSLDTLQKDIGADKLLKYLEVERVK